MYEKKSFNDNTTRNEIYVAIRKINTVKIIESSSGPVHSIILKILKHQRKAKWKLRICKAIIACNKNRENRPRFVSRKSTFHSSTNTTPKWIMSSPEKSKSALSPKNWKINFIDWNLGKSRSKSIFSDSRVSERKLLEVLIDRKGLD